MATSSENINLIRTKTGNSSQLDAIGMSLRNTAYIAVAIFVIAGVFSGITYVYFTRLKESLEATKTQFIQEVDSNKTKEGLLLSIKARTQTVQKAMANQKPWAKLLDNLATFVVPPSLSSISVDEQNKISVTIKTSTVDDLLGVVAGFTKLASNNQLVNPQLLSVTMGRNGAAQIAVSFIAVF